MKKSVIIVLLILVVCFVHAEDDRKIRITSSGLFFGKYEYKYTSSILPVETEVLKTNFPILYSLGVELEFTTKNSFIKGIGFNVIPPAEQITDDAFENFDESKHRLKEIYTLYLFGENIDSLGRSNIYGRLNYGTGIPYIFYGAFGMGYSISDRWSVEITFNGHLSTIFWANSTIMYVNLKTGFSF